jgi:hypothetical protein
VDYQGKTKHALTIENDDASGLDRLLAESFAAAEPPSPPAPAST